MSGKGDKQRPTDSKKYSNGWDLIWGDKGKKSKEVESNNQKKGRQ